MFILCTTQGDRLLKYISNGEEYLLQSLKFASLSSLLIAFLVVNLFCAKPQYLIIKINRDFTATLEKRIVELIDKLMNSEIYKGYQEISEKFLKNLNLNAEKSIVKKTLKLIREFCFENTKKAMLINSWQFCQNFKIDKILLLDNCDKKHYKELQEFIVHFNQVRNFLENDRLIAKNTFQIEWPIVQLTKISDLMDPQISEEIYSFFQSDFFSKNRMSIWKNSIILFFRTLPLNLLVFLFICMPILIYTKDLFKLIKAKRELILSEVPITIIAESNKKTTLENIGLYFSEEQKKEIYFVDYMLSKLKDFSFCLQGEKGLGKTQTAKYLCARNGGGYIVNLSKVALMGEEGMKIFYELIKDCMNRRKILIIDDSEGVMISRSTLYEQTGSKEVQKSVENIKAIVIALLSVLSFHKFNCIFITNSSQEIDEAFERRVYMVRFNSHEKSFETVIDKKFRHLSPSFKSVIKREFSNKVSYRSVNLIAKLYEDGVITRNQIYSLLKNAAFFEHQNEVNLKCINADV